MNEGRNNYTQNTAADCRGAERTMQCKMPPKQRNKRQADTLPVSAASHELMRASGVPHPRLPRGLLRGSVPFVARARLLFRDGTVSPLLVLVLVLDEVHLGQAIGEDAMQFLCRSSWHATFACSYVSGGGNDVLAAVRTRVSLTS